MYGNFDIFMSIFFLFQVIAAITYQIVPADTQYAEIPIAAVNSMYQHNVFPLCFCQLLFGCS